MEVHSPIKNIPACWDDDKRMTALFAPFRKRELNPVDYDSKLKFWQDAILNWCMEKHVGTFNVSNIQDEFKRKGRIPLCLSAVIDELNRKGDIKNKEDFLRINPHQTWTDWAVSSLIKTPVVWSFSKLKEALLEIDNNEVEYVSLEFLKKKSEELLQLEDQNKNVYTFQEIRSLLSADECIMPNDTVNLVIHWLQINNLASVKMVEDTALVKLAVKGKKEDMSDLDISAFILEENISNLKKAIEILEKEKEESVQSAREYLRKGMRETAKTYLRRKKELEKIIIKRAAACENMEILSSRINDASSDSQVLETYKTAISALKATLKENGLDEDVVHETISEIQEVNEMHDEIQSALAEPVSPTCDVELEEELMEILSNARQLSDNVPVLPDVPSTDTFEEKKRIEESKKMSEQI